jgi:hypothetical protein
MQKKETDFVFVVKILIGESLKNSSQMLLHPSKTVLTLPELNKGLIQNFNFVVVVVVVNVVVVVASNVAHLAHVSGSGWDVLS